MGRPYKIYCVCVFPANSVAIEYYFFNELYIYFSLKITWNLKRSWQNIYDKLLMQTFCNAKYRGGIVLV